MKILIILLTILLTSSISYATLTVNNIPRTKTGSTTPVLQNSAVSDNGTTVSSSEPLSITGTATATSFTGAGTGLTGTAASLNIGGNAATVTNGVYNTQGGSVYQVPLNLTTAGSSGAATLSVQGTLNIPSYTGGGGSALWQTGNVGINTFNNVGIGSTNPGTTLDVQGTVRSVGVNVQAGNVGIDTMAISGQLLDVYGTLPIFNITPSTFIVTTFGINNNYNIGIGTTSPNAMLDIASPGAYFAPNDGNGSNYTLKLHSNIDQDNILLSNNNNTSVSQSNGGVFVKFTTPDHYAPGLGKFGTLLNTLMLQTYQNVNLGLGTNAKDQMTFVTSPNGGNIGVGTIVPLNALDVESTVGDTVFSGVTQTSGTLGNVGIGSLHPGTILDVQGTIRTTGFTLNSSPVAGDILMSNNIGVGSWQPASSVGSGGGGGSGTVNSGTQGQFSYYASSTTAVSNQTPLSTDGTNVGVGTTGPVAKLEVNGTANTFVVTSTGNVGINTWNPGAVLDVEGTSSNAIFGGNVGIGTNSIIKIIATPNGVSQINLGQIDSSYTNQASIPGEMGVNIGGNGYYILTAITAQNYTSTESHTPEFVITSDNGTAMSVTGNVIGRYVMAGAPDTHHALNQNANSEWIAYVGQPFTANAMGTIMALKSIHTNMNVPTEDMRIDALGNVGIGTTTPFTTLDIQGTQSTGTFVFINNPDPTYRSSTSGDGGMLIKGNTSSEFTGYDTASYSSTHGAAFNIGADNGTAMTVGSRLGEFGFFASPDTNHGTNTNGNVEFQAFADQNYSASAQGAYATMSTTPDNTTSRNEVMRWTASGNVGIGSASPGEALDIDGSIRVFNIKSTTGNRYVCINSSGVLISQSTACIGT